MDVFKLKPGLNKIYPISLDQFTEATSKDSRYFHEDGDKKHFFAVCPACDNPIQIIGLYAKEGSTRKPYGRHYPHSIEGLANYVQANYEDCPYHRISSSTSSKRKKSTNPLSLRILKALTEHFDQVVYVLRESTGLRFSQNLLRNMLEDYFLTDGWRYRQATMSNLPWTFAESSGQINLFAQILHKDSQLYRAINQHCPEVEFRPSGYSKDWVQIKNRPGKHVSLYLLFHKHHLCMKEEKLIETIEMRITRQEGEKNVIILRQRIPIDQERFINLVNAKSIYRDQKLIDLAEEQARLRIRSTVRL